jgi:DNA uptake protein ComE-like DNA-binding protein
MKRFTSSLVLGAFLVALAAPMALAQSTPTMPAKPAAEKSTKARSAPSHAGMHKATVRMETTKKEMVDLNSASKEELMKLPGMTDAWAEKIISDRPYKTKLDVLHKKVVPAAEYHKIRGLVIAKEAASEKK